MPTEENPDRPLTGKGVQIVTAIASILDSAGIRTGRILHSGKLRAEQTAQLLAQVLDPGGELRAIKNINPNDPVREFVKKMNKYGTDCMFVGHLPFMENLAALLLCGDETSRPLAFTPGTIACLHDPDGAGWRLEWMIGSELVEGVINR